MQLDKSVLSVADQIRSLKEKLKLARSNTRHFKWVSKYHRELVDGYRDEIKRLRDEITAYQVRVGQQNQQIAALRQHPQQWAQSQRNPYHPLDQQQMNQQMATQQLYEYQNHLMQQGVCTCVPGRASLLR